MSNGNEMCDMGNIVNNIVITLYGDRQMVTKQNGDHFVMYRNIDSLCCAPGINIVLQVNYTPIFNRKMIDDRQIDK